MYRLKDSLHTISWINDSRRDLTDLVQEVILYPVPDYIIL